MAHDGTEITRRRVLRTGAVASITAAGLTGVAGAKGNGKGRGSGRGGGGRGFITTTATELLDGSFTITGEVDNDRWNPTGISPSCRGNSKPQDHVPYDTDVGPWVFFPADRTVNTGTEYEVVNSTGQCGDVGDGREWIKVITKPA